MFLSVSFHQTETVYCKTALRKLYFQSCVPGTYQDVAGSVSCKACPPGQACPGSGSVVPTTCQSGEYSLAAGTACETCPAGHYCPTTTDMPINCTEGHYQAAEGRTSLNLVHVMKDDLKLNANSSGSWRG